jgi:hypothetical protein
VSLFSWVRDLFRSTPQYPTMLRPGVGAAQVRLRWVAPQADIYLVGVPDIQALAVEKAYRWWNGVAGRQLMSPPCFAIGDMVRAFDEPAVRAGLHGAILVRVDGTDRDHGDTVVEYNRRDGTIISAVVTLPGASRNLAAVATHELGHALGLDHAAEGTLMGPRVVSGPLPLAYYQATYVKTLGPR